MVWSRNWFVPELPPGVHLGGGFFGSIRFIRIVFERPLDSSHGKRTRGIARFTANPPSVLRKTPGSDVFVLTNGSQKRGDLLVHAGVTLSSGQMIRPV